VQRGVERTLWFVAITTFDQGGTLTRACFGGGKLGDQQGAVTAGGSNSRGRGQ